MDRYGCLKINGIQVIEWRLTLCLRSSATSGFYPIAFLHWRMEGNQRFMPWLEYPHGAHLVQGLGPRFFVFLKHPEFQSLRDDPESVECMFDPLDENGTLDEGNWFVFWCFEAFFLMPNFSCRWLMRSIPQVGGSGKIVPLKLNYLASIGVLVSVGKYAAAKRLTPIFLGWYATMLNCYGAPISINKES